MRVYLLGVAVTAVAQQTVSLQKRDKLHLIHAQVIFRHGARVPVYDVPGLASESGWASTAEAVPLPAVTVRHAKSLADMGFPPAERHESTLRFGRSAAGPGTLTEKGARMMVDQVRRHLLLTHLLVL